MKIKFWGVRGSIPTPGKDTLIYGGNTSCISVEVDDKFLIFDAGSGLRICGNYLMSKGKSVDATLFITHTHWDHIQGFPFFVPAYIPGNTFKMYGPPSDVSNYSIRQIMEFQTRYEFFPIHLSQLGSDIEYFDCKEGKVDIDDLEIYACRTNHPVTCLAYKVIHNNNIFIYSGDHEPYRNIYRDNNNGNDTTEDQLLELDKEADEQNQRFIDFCKYADVLCMDGQYSDEEYETKKGWGHSSYSSDILLAEKASVKHLIITHHEPMNTDKTLSIYEKELKNRSLKKDFKLDFSKEGMEIEF